MWLLDVRTRKLVHAVDETQKYGRYAILSHVWEDDEVSFQDIERGVAEHKGGYWKIEQTCRRALADRLDYCWIDTACIDKTSSAELSEAINSMYRWYFEAKVCYAYLYDVPDRDFRESTWFYRGWTLQELIAPGYVEFYDASWQPIGSKIGRLQEIADVTRIDVKVLRDRTTLTTVSVAARMAWAANRTTSREEDRAYSLMGLFGVNMAMLYGEGPKAFARLQEEIIKSSTDHSILAWLATEQSQTHLLFAPTPQGFRHAHNILSWSSPGIDESFDLTNKGLRISLPAVETEDHPSRLTVILNCRYADDVVNQIGLLVKKQPHGMIVPYKDLKSTVCQIANYQKPDGTYTGLRNIDRKHLPTAKWMNLMILRQPASVEDAAPSAIWTQKIRIHNTVGQLVHLQTHPKEAWNPKDCSMNFVMTGDSEHDRGYIVFGEKGGGKYKYALVLGQEITAGQAEPRVSLLRDSDVPSLTTAFRSLSASRTQQTAKIEFHRNMSELLAGVERRLSNTGDVEWTISLSLEQASTSLRRQGHQLLNYIHSPKPR